MDAFDALAAALYATPLSQALRASIWLYPLVNTLHVIGIALLGGAITALDLRLLGTWRGVALAPLARVLVPVAATGVALAIGSGVLLFVTRAPDYVAEPLFAIKLVLIVLALANVAALRFTRAWLVREQAAADASSAPALRVAGALSLLLWLGVLVAGRLIGYR